MDIKTCINKTQGLDIDIDTKFTAYKHTQNLSALQAGMQLFVQFADNFVLRPTVLLTALLLCS